MESFEVGQEITLNQVNKLKRKLYDKQWALMMDKDKGGKGFSQAEWAQRKKNVLKTVKFKIINF